MSDLDVHPVEQVIDPADARPCEGPELLAPREVPLGGPRAMPVLRALPNRPRHLIGAWCFVDVYGPVDVGAGPGMVVPPHPHTGLQTVSWIVRGEVEHRDSIGSHATVRPGGVGLMTAGRGIAHSESTPDEHGPVLHGAQLWIALPRHVWRGAPDFEAPHPLPRATFAASSAPRADDSATVSAASMASDEPGVRAVAGEDGVSLVATVLVGRFAGVVAPTTVHSPLVGVGLHADGCLDAELRLDTAFEHGVVALGEGVRVDNLDVPVGGIAYLPAGTGSVLLTTRGAADAMLIGGEPFDERVVMFWNFVAPSHDDVLEARRPGARAFRAAQRRRAPAIRRRRRRTRRVARARPPHRAAAPARPTRRRPRPVDRLNAAHGAAPLRDIPESDAARRPRPRRAPRSVR
ncbi:hypothetical protein HNR16_000190 [Pseudoclavibacter chungangensis]|uniref:pirin family protein n=1 Tax=Pseudoclavibacter chungangensis TaxID=587635 RepID=UPI00181DC3C5|nr:pirin family protein [Pseudoclavibacter chungangensis]NYJ65402.1 hypothetical protein [Pseudoclavibacter chungangensis]